VNIKNATRCSMQKSLGRGTFFRNANT